MNSIRSWFSAMLLVGCSSTAFGQSVLTLHLALDATSHNSHLVFLRPPEDPTSALMIRATPDLGIANEVHSWTVEVIRPGTDDNLLAPAADWHGLQDFTILPRDVQKSSDQDQRVRYIRGRGVSATIELLSGETSGEADEHRTFKKLDMSLTVAPDWPVLRHEATP